MTLAQLYCFARDFAAPFATVFAAGVAAISTYVFQARSHRRESQRLALELFDKKYEIYSVFNQMMISVIGVGDPERIDHAAIGAQRAKIDEGRFFFDKETMRFIGDCNKACERFLVCLGNRPRGLIAKHHPDTVDKSADEAALLNADIRRLYALGPEKFERELKISR